MNFVAFTPEVQAELNRLGFPVGVGLPYRTSFRSKRPSGIANLNLSRIQVRPHRTIRDQAVIEFSDPRANFPDYRFSGNRLTGTAQLWLNDAKVEHARLVGLDADANVALAAVLTKRDAEEVPFRSVLGDGFGKLYRPQFIDNGSLHYVSVTLNVSGSSAEEIAQRLLEIQRLPGVLAREP